MKRLLNFQKLIAALVFIVLTAACEKDILSRENIPNERQAAAQIYKPVVINRTDGEKNDQERRTVLGNLRENPYTVEKVAEAGNIIRHTNIVKAPTTHLYISFEPQTVDEMVSLANSDLFLLDFPIEYEILEMGDYYYEPADKNDFPVFYTFVTEDEILPDVPHTLISELNLEETNAEVMRKAFELTGNAEEGIGLYPNSIAHLGEIGHVSEIVIDPDLDCRPGCPGYPCCLTGLVLCDQENVPDWCDNVDFDCYPGKPNYPECLGLPDKPTNDCGCTLNSNIRKPGGCVRVEDTQLGMEGVRNVKIIGWNGWFRLDRTFTDDSGCWSINREYKGKAWFWVKFKNGGTKVCSAARGARLWQHIWALKDPIGRINGPNFNNITINYNMWTEQGSQAHRYWGGASINNAFYEFQDFAASSGINAVPSITLYAGHGRRGQGFALMTSYIGPSGLGTIIASELFETNGLSGFLSAIDFFADFGVEATEEAEAMFAAAGGGIAALIAPFIPDVMIGTNWNNSDELRELAFHELGHASLYPSMGNTYWEQLATAELVADALDGHPWGVPTSQGVGRIAVVESWADNIGHLFAHGKYGVNNSILENTYLIRLEETRNFRVNHVPIGIYLDLFDTGTEPISFDFLTGGSGLVMDNVSGFTTGQIFGLFDPSITSPTILQGRINTSLTPGSGNTVSQVNALFSSY